MSNVTPKSVKTLLTLLVAALGVFGLSTATFVATAADRSSTDTAATALAQPPCGDTSSYDVVPLGDLPPEAAETEDLIASGGPFPYPEDGTVFQNREALLPDCDSGYYHEYTVETPGSPDRGARRIVTGSAGEHFYTDDHYASFSLIDLDGAPPSECGDPAGLDEVALSSLPAPVADTVDLVRAGGPFPFPNDGTVYENREGVLPDCAAGYYHLYAVPSSSGADSGDQRLITGGGEFYYTPDHYASFVVVNVTA